MQEINLLENRIKDAHTTWKKHTRIYITILSVILVLIIGGVVLLYLYNNNLVSQKDELVQENQGLKLKLDSNSEDKTAAKNFQAQLGNMRYLVDNHVYFTPFFEELSETTFIRAKYSSLTVSTDGVVHLEGEVNDYNDLSKLLLGLSTSSKIKNVKLLGSKPGQGEKKSLSVSINFTAINVFNKK
jgi:hypothetical protein